MDVKTERIRLTGGAAKNDGIAQVVADVFQAPVERFDVLNSAALGAALIAAVADGHDLPALQATFCKAAADSSLQPNPSLAGTYNEALGRFQTLLNANL
jgi:sugar (pentulose or hexulose) kinase